MPASTLPILYSFRRCPYAMRARLAIAASGIVCELREVDLKAKPASLLQASSKGTVPVLVLPDRVVDQSREIMHWALQQNDPRGWLSNYNGEELIDRSDEHFKFHLDRYKYPHRYENADALHHRAEASLDLQILSKKLGSHLFLEGDRFTFLDAALLPFVRQFAETDRAFFNEQPWQPLVRWLDAFIASEIFQTIMVKHPNWIEGSKGSNFPS